MFLLISGSPFQFTVGPIAGGGAHKVHAAGQGLVGGEVNQPGQYSKNEGAQWLSGRVLDSRPRGCGFEPHRRHWVVVREQDTLILA